jgi:hypothetical protein
MTRQIKTDIQINATPEKVWQTLGDFNNYPNWNPFIKSITGKVKVGQKITVSLHPPGARGMTFKPTVLALDRNKEFRWLGHLLFTGLFDGEHQFELTDNGNGTTTFRQNETLKGILVPFFRKMIDVNTTNGFHQMNQQLKLLAEK